MVGQECDELTISRERSSLFHTSEVRDGLEAGTLQGISPEVLGFLKPKACGKKDDHCHHRQQEERPVGQRTEQL